MLGLHIKDSGAQQMCANSWKELDDNTRIYFENEAKKVIPSMVLHDKMACNF